MYPLESVASATTATIAQLTTLHSSGWEPRTEYEVPMEEPMEQPALHTEVSGVHTLLATEREARSSHTVRKRKECPTTEENTHIRSRLKLSKSAVTTVQALSRMNSPCISVNQTLPVTESARIQHQGQVQPRRTLMARERDSTRSLSDVTEVVYGVEYFAPSRWCSHL